MGKHVLTCALFAAALAITAQADELADRFQQPPDAARPRAYWFHMSGNITKAGITADLEAMKEMGLGGTLFMNVSVALPTGLVETKDFMSPAWQDCFQHMLNESARLGLDFGSALCDGWGNAGGPAIPPELAMQRLTWSETRVRGGDDGRDRQTAAAGQLAGLLPRRGGARFSDAARRPRAGAATKEERSAPASSRRPGRTAVRFRDARDRARIDAGGCGRFVAVWRPRRGNRGQRRRHGLARGEEVPRLLAREAHGPDHRVRTGHGPAFSLAVARRRVSGETAQIKVAEAALSNRERIHFWQAKAALVTHPEHGGGAERYLDSGAADAPGIAPSSIVNLTGQTTWIAPEGDWTVLRIGHTPTGAHNAPATKAGVGLECDKFNPRGVEAQHEAFVDKVLAAATPAGKRAYKHTWIDSWEVGPQNWTARFPEEFKARRGYDITPWLPVLAGGRIVDSRDKSERFLWDFRRTIADLLVDHYWKRSMELASKRGIEFRAESFGRQQFMYDPMNYARACDMPCGEFWVGGGPRVDCKVAASAAHLSGRQIAGAEAFTAGRGNWLDDPVEPQDAGRPRVLPGRQSVLLPPLRAPAVAAPGARHDVRPLRHQLRAHQHLVAARQGVGGLPDALPVAAATGPLRGRRAGDARRRRAELRRLAARTGDPAAGRLRLRLRQSRCAARIARRAGRHRTPATACVIACLMLPATGRATPALMREALRLAEAGATLAAPREFSRAHGMTPDEEVAALWKKIIATGRRHRRGELRGGREEARPRARLRARRATPNCCGFTAPTTPARTGISSRTSPTRASMPCARSA